MGWARANVLYDTQRGPPDYNSLKELALIIVWRSRQATTVAQTRAHAQASLGGEKALEAFNEYRDLVNRVDNDARDDRYREKLKALERIQEIRFRPMVPIHHGPSLKVFNKEDVL